MNIVIYIKASEALYWFKDATSMSCDKTTKAIGDHPQHLYLYPHFTTYLRIIRTAPSVHQLINYNFTKYENKKIKALKALEACAS